MNEASQWQFALSQQIGKAYASNPKAQVIMVAGSTGRGTTDRYSDLEIDVYYSTPPTEEKRRATAERSGGTLLDLDEGDDEWAEEISIGGFHLGTSTFLVETMERYLKEVLDDYSTRSLAQIRLYSLLHARTISGESLVTQWQTRASVYPTPLIHAMLRENLHFEDFGYAEDMLAARDDQLCLYDTFCRVERQFLGALLGLNRIYLPNPGFKSMDEIISLMSITPSNLSVRLKQAFHLPPTEGVHQLHSLIEEVFTLVENHYAGFQYSIIQGECTPETRSLGSSSCAVSDEVVGYQYNYPRNNSKQKSTVPWEIHKHHPRPIFRSLRLNVIYSYGAVTIKLRLMREMLAFSGTI